MNKTMPTFAEFEGSQQAQGYEQVLERTWGPLHETGEHTHDFDASGLVVDGEMWIDCADRKLHLLPGDTFQLARGTPHSERYGPRRRGLLGGAPQCAGHRRMSALFTPFAIGPLTLANRIVIAPMCQYSAHEGTASDWHMIHLGSLALSGAGLLIIEASAVSAEARITPGDLGLYSDANEAGLARVLAAIRAHSAMPVAIQLAHAGRKASSKSPWEGGQQIPQEQAEGWVTVAPSPLPHGVADEAPLELDRAGLDKVKADFVAAAKRAASPRPRRHRTARRTRLPAARIPVADREPADG